MLALLTPIILLSDHMPSWLFYLLFFGVFFLVILPIHFGLGPLGRRLARDVNDAAIHEDSEYRRSLGIHAKVTDLNQAEKKS